jgi:hypothetical protein
MSVEGEKAAPPRGDAGEGRGGVETRGAAQAQRHNPATGLRVVAILNEEDLAEDLMARLAEHGGPSYVSPPVRFEASVALARAKAGAPIYMTPSMRRPCDGCGVTVTGYGDSLLNPLSKDLGKAGGLGATPFDPS